MTDGASTGCLLSPPVIPRDPLMWADFQSLCDLGGRLAGSASEAAALVFARLRLAAVASAKVRDDPVEYLGWRCRTAQLTNAMTGVSLQCTPLLGTASAAGLVAEVLDLASILPDCGGRAMKRTSLPLLDGAISSRCLAAPQPRGRSR